MITIFDLRDKHMVTWNLSNTTHHVLICNGGSCMRKNGEEVTQAIRDEIKSLGLDEYIHTTRTRCNGRCEDACVVLVYPEGIWYKTITPDMGRKIINQHIQKNEPLHPYIAYRYQHANFQPTNISSIGISKSKT